MNSYEGDRPDPEETPRFRGKPIQVSLYESKDDVGFTAAFVGETSSVSRKGVGVRVDPKRFRIPKQLDELEGETFLVEFHIPGMSDRVPRGNVEMAGKSEDPRYRIYLGMTFESEFDIDSLLLNR
ncbi:MAG: hypothetical protein ABEJ65_03350 [bacterium]